MAKSTSDPRKKKGMALVLNTSPAEAISSVISEDSGVKKQRFKRAMLRTGIYEHPIDGWKMLVTSDKLASLAASAKKMLAHGDDIDVVKDHSFSADDHLGFIVDVFVEDDTLYGVHEVRGDTAIDLVQRVPRTSVWMERNHKSGTGGREYGECILHNSVSVQPVVAGMHDEFIPIAASHGGRSRRLPVFRFSGALPGDETMDLKKLAELIGVDPSEINSTNADALLADYLKKRDDDRKKIDEQLQTAMTEIEKLKAAKPGDGEEDNPADDDDSSGDGKAEMDEDTQELVAESVETLAASCVEKGCITPAVKKRLCSVLVGEPGKRNVRALSRKASGTGKSLASEIFRALAENDVVETNRERSGGQSGGDNNDTTVIDGMIGDHNKSLSGAGLAL